MEKMWNLVISFLGNMCFWREVFFFQKILKICKKFTFLKTQFLTIFQGNFVFCPALVSIISFEKAHVFIFPTTSFIAIGYYFERRYDTVNMGESCTNQMCVEHFQCSQFHSISFKQILTICLFFKNSVWTFVRKLRCSALKSYLWQLLVSNSPPIPSMWENHSFYSIDFEWRIDWSALKGHIWLVDLTIFTVPYLRSVINCN